MKVLLVLVVLEMMNACIEYETVDINPLFTAQLKENYDDADYLWTPVFAKMKCKPCKRYKLAACLVYDCVYMYGGRGICTALKDLWRYDIGNQAHLNVYCDLFSCS